MPDILAMLPNNPGDVLMAAPALRGLKQQGHTVHFLVDRECADIASCNPDIDCLHVFERAEMKQALARDRMDGMRSLAAFVDTLSRRTYDAVINLFQGESTALIASLLRARIIAGAKREPGGRKTLSGFPAALLYAIPFARAYAPAHAADLFCLMANVAPNGTPGEMRIPKPVKEAVRGRLGAQGFAPGHYVVVHACSAHRKKEWDHDEVAALVALLGKNGVRVVLTGSEHEKGRLEKIIAAAGCGTALNCAGVFNMIESAAVIAGARCIVTGDTVAMHMAAATGTRVIAVFAPTSPLETGPYCANATVFQADCWCRGLYSGECSMHERCTTHVSAAHVFHEVLGRPFIPQKGISRFESRFDKHGFIDYADQGTSGYAPVSRSLVQTCDHLNVSQLEKTSLETLQRLLKENIDCLSRLSAASKNGPAIAGLAQQNAGVERQLGRLTGIGAYLAAVLRLRNNSIEGEALDELANAMRVNAEDLLRMVNKNLENCAVIPPVPLVEGGMDSRYVLMHAHSVRPFTGSIEVMAAALEKDDRFAACAGKIIDENDLVVSAGDGSGKGLPRFNEQVIQYREIGDGSRDFMLVRKGALDQAGVFSGRVLYCPDAEAIFINP